MSVRVDSSHNRDGVEVPTLEEFKKLAAHVDDLQKQLALVTSDYLKSGDTVSLNCGGQFVTFITDGEAIKSRQTPYLPQFQGWHIEKR